MKSKIFLIAVVAWFLLIVKFVSIFFEISIGWSIFCVNVFGLAVFVIVYNIRELYFREKEKSPPLPRMHGAPRGFHSKSTIFSEDGHIIINDDDDFVKEYNYLIKKNNEGKK